ncbi:unnamed protein product [Heligmosomoides polygyrus]|uniref:PLAC domain-containing protein n=1 Tax=Heligmosomoides polygyrus TaxID=6339 RepID=A0A183FVF4_HELPZ|nr:unnamed protein product [Heligmosomoides polygyrus]
MFLLPLFAALSLCKVRQIEPIPLDPFFSFNENPAAFAHANAQVAVMPKKTEKLPLQKAVKHFDSERPIPDVMPHIKEADVLEPLPGVAPKMTGKVVSTEDVAATGFDYFNFGEGEGPVTNPAATYLDGGNFDKIAAPKCRMVGCSGPLPNDGSLSMEAPTRKSKACHQTFVPLNGCTDNKGYPMGMLCSICCDCTAAFVREMKKTRGFLIAYNGN